MQKKENACKSLNLLIVCAETKIQCLNTVLSCGLCADIKQYFVSVTEFFHLITFAYFMSFVLSLFNCFWYMSFPHKNVFVFTDVTFEVLLNCSLVPSDDHRKKNESKVHVFTFSLHIKNMCI